ncbi:MAG: hypothetical protein QNJ56_12345 [Gammaproteobacteria bacterium]|nr:hypothetical protein [Gammaproteobacteria bacterium]
MPAYVLEIDGISVGSMSCATCDQEWVHDTITTDEGETVHVSKCPDGQGMVKPRCVVDRI